MFNICLIGIYFYQISDNIFYFRDASEISTQSQSVKLLTGLTSRIDRVLIPACESPTKCACQGS